MNNEINNSRLAQLFKMLALQADDAFIHYAIAMEFNKEHNYLKACEWLESTLQLDPKYIAAYYHLAQMHIALHQKEQALVALEKGISTAKELKDQKSLAELQNSKMNIELED